MKNTKRILSVTIKRMIEEDPDTSYLGEYSNRATSGYSIDRAHSEDCASVVPVSQDGVQKLRNARAYIVDLQNAIGLAFYDDPSEWDELEEAYNLLDSLADETPDCDCSGRYYERGTYRYFNPSWQSYKGNTEENIRKYCRQDFDRMESYNNQQWCYIGIRAEATYTQGVGVLGSVVQILTSGGLWGTESDSDKAYLDSVAQDELASLKTELKALGFSTRAISVAFRTVETTEE
jgi:hypothetical protein